MPELPEVQTIVDDLIDEGLVGKKISGAQVYWGRTLYSLTQKKFQNEIKNKTIKKIYRRAKYIVFSLSSGYTVAFHLRMTGKLYLRNTSKDKDKHEHVIIKLTGGKSLCFHDVRKFGKIYLFCEGLGPLADLGFEPLSEQFKPDVLFDLLFSKNRMLKPFLLDQKVIAGLGNIYVDEALWGARLHPCRISSTILQSEAKSLCKAIKVVLKRGLKNKGTTLGNGKGNFYSGGSNRGRNKEQLKVFHRAGLPCVNCGNIIKRIIVGQRSTHICSKCQK